MAALMMAMASSATPTSVEAEEQRSIGDDVPNPSDRFVTPEESANDQAKERWGCYEDNPLGNRC